MVGTYLVHVPSAVGQHLLPTIRHYICTLREGAVRTTWAQGWAHDLGVEAVVQGHNASKSPENI
jgi:hypothetical protein